MRTLRENFGNVGIRTRMCKVANFSYEMMNWTSFLPETAIPRRRLTMVPRRRLKVAAMGVR